jgi:hypothetical protein
MRAWAEFVWLNAWSNGGSCEHENGHLGFIQDMEFLDEMSDYCFSAFQGTLLFRYLRYKSIAGFMF